MSEPGSSGKVGPTPISDVYVGEQVRPSFHIGGQELRLGDRVTGIHRGSRQLIEGTVVEMYDTPCLSTTRGQIFPLERIAIHEVQPPLFQ